MTGGNPVLPPQAASSFVKSNAVVAAHKVESVRMMQRV
jgi:hypothetical protein